ncbi:MAG: YggS family pyridoxal phosphate-dependent enzyme [bacterium]
MNDIFQQRVDAVRARIASACARCGRAPGSVLLVAVSKTHPPETVEEVARCGISVFGENKVQEAGAKIPLCPSHLTWHLVGHLQSNKVRLAVELFDTIHSVDSLRLMELIDRACDAVGRRMKVLVEVNVSGEASKFGMKPEAVPAVLAAAGKLPRIDLLGVMTMPPFTEDPQKARPHFQALRNLRDGWQTRLGIPLPELSMGMSHDFEVAIEEDATMIRVGTSIFGTRAPRKVVSDDES